MNRRPKRPVLTSTAPISDQSNSASWSSRRKRTPSASNLMDPRRSLTSKTGPSSPPAFPPAPAVSAPSGSTSAPGSRRPPPWRRPRPRPRLPRRALPQARRPGSPRAPPSPLPPPSARGQGPSGRGCTPGLSPRRTRASCSNLYAAPRRAVWTTNLYETSQPATAGACRRDVTRPFRRDPVMRRPRARTARTTESGWYGFRRTRTTRFIPVPPSHTRVPEASPGRGLSRPRRRCRSNRTCPPRSCTRQ